MRVARCTPGWRCSPNGLALVLWCTLEHIALHIRQSGASHTSPPAHLQKNTFGQHGKARKHRQDSDDTSGLGQPNTAWCTARGSHCKSGNFHEGNSSHHTLKHSSQLPGLQVLWRRHLRILRAHQASGSAFLRPALHVGQSIPSRKGWACRASRNPETPWYLNTSLGAARSDS